MYKIEKGPGYVAVVKEKPRKVMHIYYGLKRNERAERYLRALYAHMNRKEQ